MKRETISNMQQAICNKPLIRNLLIANSLLRFSFLVFSFSFFISASAFTATDSTKVSLLTCTPGEELYSVFGHSGIRVCDKEQNVDVVFNYGMFDFTKPNFYTNFLRGILIYAIGVDDFRSFYLQYTYENRGVSEQILNLSQSEKQKLIDFLIWNAQPENCDYRYDFLLDNCATRIRDVFEKNTEGSLKYNTTNYDSLRTFRKMIDEYSYHKRWENFGMNLLIGVPVDRPTTYREQLFLPDNLRDAFGTATVHNGEKFVLETNEIIPAPTVDKSKHFSDPEYVFSVILLLLFLLTIAEIYFGFWLKFADYFLLFSTGLVGCLFLAMGLFTQHWTTHWNLNILWALPTNAVLAQLLFFKKESLFTKRFVLATFGIEAFFILFHALLPQSFQIGMILISLMLSLRLFRWYYALRK
ncbi:MAG TPA: DUF4105 domain-containing protein [Chitinophagales bacterium]